MGLVNVAAAFLLPHHPALQRAESWLPLGNPHLSRHLLLASGIALAVLARGIRLGHRSAWWGAFFTLLASVLLQVQLGGTRLEGALAAAFLVILVAWKDDFEAHPDPASARLGGRWIRNVALGVPVSAWLAVLALHTQFTPLPDPLHVASDVLRRLAFLAPRELMAVGRRGEWLLEAIPLVFWSGLIVALAQLVRAARAPQPREGDRETARELIMAWGRTGTAYMSLWRGNTYFFGPGHDTVVTYRVHGTTAVVLGDPVGPPDALARAVTAFLEHCRLRGWNLVFLAASEAARPTYEAAGLQLLQIGEEALVPLSEPGVPRQGVAEHAHGAQPGAS